MSSGLERQINIRQAGESDIETVVSLVADFYVEEKSADERAITAGKEKLRGPIAEKLADRKRNLYFLAYLDQELVGILQLFLLSDRLGELILFYVLPKFRNQGIGEFLVRWGLVKLKSLGIKFTRTEVRENNTISRKIISKFNPSIYSYIYTIEI